MKLHFLVGALGSGSGKTTFTAGCMRALCRRGLTVQPYKCGPDYIDPQFHSIATGRESVNLDCWMGSPEHVSGLFRRYGEDADSLLVEGVMGLFDGYDKALGSSANLAKLLDIPVVLVVDARSTAYTAAALLYGAANFLPGLRIAGVVFNRVGSQVHLSLLKQACRDAGLRCLGHIPRSSGLEIPSRHLGLSLGELEKIEEYISQAADLVESGIDMDALFEAACPPAGAISAPAEARASVENAQNGPSRGLKIAVARDEAFNFIYRENIRRLREVAEVVFFSPLEAEHLPEADILYLPGGYPELYAGRLSANAVLRREIYDMAMGGGRILAECGGMLYLSEAIEGVDGGAFPMCGVFPFRCTMEGARLHLGYRSIEPLHRKDAETQQRNIWRGHEFHYSKIVDPGCAESVALQRDVRGGEVATGLYRHKNVLAGYTHLYWGEADPLSLWHTFRSGKPDMT